MIHPHDQATIFAGAPRPSQVTVQIDSLLKTLEAAASAQMELAERLSSVLRPVQPSGDAPAMLPSSKSGGIDSPLVPLATALEGAANMAQTILGASASMLSRLEL